MDVLKRYRVPFVRPASLCLPGSLILQYSTDFDYSRGDYGLQRESMLFDVPLGATADYGDCDLVPLGNSFIATASQREHCPPAVAVVARLWNLVITAVLGTS